MVEPSLASSSTWSLSSQLATWWGPTRPKPTNESASQLIGKLGPLEGPEVVYGMFQGVDTSSLYGE